MARKIMNRRGLRAAHDAAERRADDTAEEEEVEEEEDADADSEGDEEDEDEEAEAEAGEGEGEGDGADEDDEAPKKKKKKPPPKKPAKPEKKPRARSRASKVTRMKVVWGVFNNSNQRVASFDYPKRSDADALAAKLTTDKKSTHFVQPVKEPLEEEKKAEK